MPAFFSFHTMFSKLRVFIKSNMIYQKCLNDRRKDTSLTFYLATKFFINPHYKKYRQQNSCDDDEGIHHRMGRRHCEKAKNACY